MTPLLCPEPEPILDICLQDSPRRRFLEMSGYAGDPHGLSWYFGEEFIGGMDDALTHQAEHPQEDTIVRDAAVALAFFAVLLGAFLL